MSKKFTITLRCIFLQMLFVLIAVPTTAQVQQVAKSKFLQPVPSQMGKSHQAPINRLGAYRPQRTNRQLSILSVPDSQDSKVHVSKTTQPLLKVKGGPQFWGMVEYSSAWNNMDEYDRPYGIYSFTASNPGQMNLLLKTGTNGPNAGGVFINDDFYYVNYGLMYDTYVTTYYYHYNTTTWEQIGYPQYGSDDQIIGNDLAYDATTNQVYGYFYNPLSFTEPSRFGTITYGEYGATVNTIATEDTIFLCLTADDNGQLYGISWAGGLWKIDKTTGAKTLVDYMGVVPSTFRQSATYDSKSKKIYWAAFRNDYTSGLYEIDPTTAAAKLVTELPDSMEISCLYIPKAEADDDAPAAISDLTALFEGSSLTGHITFTMPSETYAGDALKGSLQYYVVANGDTIANGNGNVGERLDVPVTVQSGSNEFYVYTKNDNGGSPQSNKISQWIGYDIPANVTDVKFDVNADNRQVTLTWTAPTTSLNGGYFDANSLKYDIVRYPDKVTVANHISGNSFTETLPKGQLKSYYYTVTACNGDQKGEAVASNKQQVGDALDLPFVDNFDTDDLYSLYTIIDANEDGTKWNESYHAFSYFYSWKNDADDWLLVPPVNMKKNEVYKLTFDIRSGASYDKEKYAVAIGQGNSPETYKELIATTELKSSNYSTVEKTFTVNTDGVYRIGFHALSDANKSGLYITKIKVEKEMPKTAPDSVNNMTIKAGDKGALEATVSFTTPTTDINGNALTSLSKVEIYRNDTLKLTTIDNPALGIPLSYIDNTPQNGMNHYSVVAFNENGEGKLIKDSVFIGIDRPWAPRHFKIHGANDLVTFTWDAPIATGVHGGYVDSENLEYSIYNSQGDTVATGIKGNQWTYDIDTDLRADVLSYRIDAQSIAGKSDMELSNSFVVGQPVTLPYAESFANGGSIHSLWWSEGNITYNSFNFCSESSDEDDGCVYWYSVSDSAYAYLNSGKITVKGIKRPVLTFDYYVTPGASMTIRALADCNQTYVDTLVTYDYATIGGEKGWRKSVVFLGDKEKNADYFVLKFLAHSLRDGTYLYLDNVAIRDMADRDLQASIIAPLAVTAGDSINVDVTVNNLGYEDISTATVDLYAGNIVVKSQALPTIKSGEKTTMKLAYAPKMGVNGEVKLYAVVNCEGDDDETNNVTDSISVAIQRPDYPAVTDLSAKSTEQGVELSWTAPATTKHIVTESFETYSPWSIDNVGPWTVLDGDTLTTNSYTCMHYPNIGEKMAYIVFNDTYGTMLDEQREIFTARTGHQFMAAFATIHDYSLDIPTADWLITPELSGEAQTVSFWAKSFTSYDEDMMIYTSTESADTASLLKNRIAYEKFSVEPTWKKFEYELPFGTKYFAVCYTSNLSGIMIDDFTYEGMPLTVAGYNIYRDGQLFGYVSVGNTKFTDMSADANNHKYTVTVVYKEGESDFSNVVQTTTGIQNVSVIDMPSGKVFTVGGVKIADDVRQMNTDKGLYIINGKKMIRR